MGPRAGNGHDAPGQRGSTVARASEAPGLAERAAAALADYQDGRPERLADLVREVTPVLWNVVRGQGVERSDAEDVVQGVWVALVRRADSIRDPNAVLAWLVVSARRAAWQAVGRRREEMRRTTPLPDPEVLPGRAPRATEPPVDASMLRAERDRVLWSRFLDLDERCRTILRAVAVADRPDYRAIADVAGMKVTSVGVTRGRCLARLRALLASDERWAGDE